MPVRSLNSSVFKWPDAKSVDQAARRRAAESEWEQMASSGRRFYQEAERVAVWIYQRARQLAGDENKDVEGDQSGPQG